MRPRLPLACADAIALLTYERSRAPDAVAALRAWWRALRRRQARAGRIGWRQHVRLMRLEQLCLGAGLALAGERGGSPWLLPERLAAPSSDMEQALREGAVHPLIDAHHTARAAAAAAVAPHDALTVLGWLLDPGCCASRWSALPRLPDAPATGQRRLAVVLHLFYPQLWPELRTQLAHLPEPFDLIVTVPAFASTPQLTAIAAEVPGVRFVPLANRGRDVLPWLLLLNRGALDGYELVCKLHGKSSPHARDGADWRRRSVAALIGSPGNASALLGALRLDPTLGVVGPSSTATEPVDDAAARHSRRHLRRLARALSPHAHGAVDAGTAFFAGTMFWFRPEALRPLADLGLRPGDFAPEMAQTDGTLAHAIERFVPTVAKAAGFRTASWDDGQQRLRSLVEATQAAGRTRLPVA